ncbi:N-acetyltransferase [Roseibium denhamense]|uniref:Acetyltransferase (GNAT) family protein n=1 Tax=Roseibium denhamense TaxID=76305 RepID=A0ABY1N759_9HYPH|nr:GNAT family N-acetyltransferase [Roseibium denhamense]MTI06055.1 N-acetyltransferase [Roseibium denhamense]SMP01633.1 Acetyltransferase (GNAT) family protein [Roseibium denhamense]
MEVYVRRLSEADVEIFRTLRLEALQNHPEAFGMGYDEAAQLPSSYFEEKLQTNLIVGGGLETEDFTAIAGLAASGQEKVKHKAIIWGVYARPEVRGKGVTRSLLKVMIDAVQDKVEQIQITVGSENEPAKKLYQSLGFEQYGLERRALKIDGQYVDEILMALDLTKPQQASES